MVAFSKCLGWRVLCAAAVTGLFGLARCQPAAPATSVPAQTPTVQSELPDAGAGSDPSAWDELAGMAAENKPEAGQPDPESGVPESEQTPAEATPAESYHATEGDDPGRPGPGGTLARPNGSRVTAELIETAPFEANPALVRLRVKMLASQAMEGMPSMTDELVNQEIDMLIEAARLPDLQAGDIFEAEVAYLGDE